MQQSQPRVLALARVNQHLLSFVIRIELFESVMTSLPIAAWFDAALALALALMQALRMQCQGQKWRFFSIDAGEHVFPEGIRSAIRMYQAAQSSLTLCESALCAHKAWVSRKRFCIR